jgi:hypothetical protein
VKKTPKEVPRPKEKKPLSASELFFDEISGQATSLSVGLVFYFPGLSQL